MGLENYFSVLKGIRLFLLDVDGILTDGQIFWGGEAGWVRTFSIRDGYGLRLLIEAGIEVGIVSGGKSESVKERIKKLGISHAYLGDEDKLASYKKIKAKIAIKDSETAYMGDELFDVPLLEIAGFSATVPEAIHEVRSIVHYITKNGGGAGAVREVADMIRYAREEKNYQSFIKRYGQESLPSFEKV